MFKNFALPSSLSLFDRVLRIVVNKSVRSPRPSLGTSHDLHDAPAVAINLAALEAETASPDRWISRARPTFLYVIYAMILWALPMGMIAAINPRISHAITTGMADYLSALPAELYTLFATGYLGYATLRQWGKVKGTDR